MIDNAKEKIRKLLSLAESAREVGSIHEAEVATQKALHLLWENGLSEADVKEHKQAELHSKEYKESDYWYGRSYIGDLVSVLSGASLCVAVRSSIKRRVKFIVYGRSENLQVFDYLFTLCVRTWENEGRKMQSGQGKAFFMPSFFRGCALGLQRKINEQKKAESNEQSVNALVKSESDSLWVLVKEQHCNLLEKAHQSRTTDDKASLLAGIQVGKNTSLTTALPAQEKAKSNLLNA